MVYFIYSSFENGIVYFGDKSSRDCISDYSVVLAPEFRIKCNENDTDFSSLLYSSFDDFDIDVTTNFQYQDQEGGWVWVYGYKYISEDGSHNNMLYRFNDHINQSMYLVNERNFWNDWCLVENTNQIFYTTSSAVYIYNLISHETILFEEIDETEYYYFHITYDKITTNIIFTTSSTIYIYNSNTLEIEKTIILNTLGPYDRLFHIHVSNNKLWACTNVIGDLETIIIIDLITQKVTQFNTISGVYLHLYYVSELNGIFIWDDFTNYYISTFNITDNNVYYENSRGTICWKCYSQFFMLYMLDSTNYSSEEIKSLGACSLAGTIENGTCICDSDHYGDRCEINCKGDDCSPNFNFPYYTSESLSSNYDPSFSSIFITSNIFQSSQSPNSNDDLYSSDYSSFSNEYVTSNNDQSSQSPNFNTSSDSNGVYIILISILSSGIILLCCICLCITISIFIGIKIYKKNIYKKLDIDTINNITEHEDDELY